MLLGLTSLRLKSGGGRSQKTGLGERRDACINEPTNYCFECTTCRYASLRMFTISRQGRALSYDACSSRPRTLQGQQNNFGYITGFWLVFTCIHCWGCCYVGRQAVPHLHYSLTGPAQSRGVGHLEEIPPPNSLQKPLRIL